ncbi:MAG: sensor histidine kinase [Pseudomonadota bacterium]
MLFKTLSAKLTAVLVGLLGLIGLLYVALSLFSTQMYLQEVNQQLNRTLANHLVSEKILMESGEINRAALEDLFHMLMVINPNIEIYLLDPGGAVLACSAPPEKLQRKSVSLQPVRDFLSGARNMPILGDDPQDSSRQKIFSAAAIPAQAAQRQGILTASAGTASVAGYLYVVLGGKAYDSAAQMLRGSYILRLSTGVVVAGVLFALLTGLLLFRLITRRLTRLTEAVTQLERGEFAEPVMLTDANASATGDEIDRLTLAFKDMAARIQNQMHALKQTDILRRELVANVSHDLRTPLASLQGYLETLLLKEGKFSEQEQRHYLEIALRHSERLGKLVTELFELAKLDAQRTPPDMEPFALSELAQDVVQEFQIAAQRQGVTLQTDFQDGLPFVCADIGLIQRVLENLIENALHYTPHGGVISVSVTRCDGMIAAQVSDTGCGISEHDLPHIFDRFYRAEKARQGHNGAGLGLAIAKRILDLHGGVIEARSAPGQGAVFHFGLPVWRAESA